MQLKKIIIAVGVSTLAVAGCGAEVTGQPAGARTTTTLKNFNLDAQTKASEPHYIAVTMRNAGPKPMEPGGIFGLFNAHNADGDKLAGLDLLGEFGKCESDVPDTLAVDAEFANCEVYLSPPGQGVDKVVFGYYGVANKRTEITWKAG